LCHQGSRCGKRQTAAKESASGRPVDHLTSNSTVVSITLQCAMTIAQYATRNKGA
jgi:hypothetical protein